MKIFGILTLTFMLFICIYLFFLPLLFLGFLIYPSTEPLASDSQTKQLDEKISLGLMDSSKQGHKTEKDYFIFVHRLRRG